MKVFKIVFSKILGLMIFLVLLFLINALDVNVYPYRAIVGFINRNALLLVMISILFMVAEIFFSFMFPFNLPGPFFSAPAAFYLTMFIFRVFVLIDTLIGETLFSYIAAFAGMIYLIVFAAVFIGGYATIIAGLVKPKKEKRVKKHKDKEWEDIGGEFRKAFSDLFRKIADSIDKTK